MTRTIPRKHINDLPVSVPPVLPEPEAVLVDGIRRLNLNEAPIAPSPKTLAAMTAALTETCKYPDHSCAALIKVLSESLKVDEDRLFFGGGSGELLLASALISVGPGEQVVTPVPVFPTFGKGVDLADGEVIEVPVDENGVNDVRAMVAAITPTTQVLYACSPNNPTGGLMSAEDIQYLAENVPDDVLLLLDEAYHEFGAFDGGPDCLKILSNRKGHWVISRTFSKAYSLAGMRVGYGIAGTPELAEAYWKVRGNFTVNRVAIAGACAAYSDVEYRQALLEENAKQRKRLSDGLSALGFKPYPSNANFVTSQAPLPTEELVAHMAKHNILLQALTWPGVGPCLRISVGSAEDTTAVLDALSNYLKENS